MLGIFWGALPISYLLSGSSILFLSVLLCIYAFLIPMTGLTRAPRIAAAFFSLMCLFITISFLVEIGRDVDILEYFGVFLFTINLTLMICLIRPEKTYQFSRNFYIASVACAGLHVALILLGAMDRIGDRYLFFGGSHPNLGGEIYGIAAYAGAISMKKRTYAILSLPIFISAFYLQSRTGFIVVLLNVLFKIYLESNGKISAKSILLGVFLMICSLAAIMSYGPIRTWFLSSVILYDNAYRGVSTGLVSGRDGLWENALNVFMDRPIFGNGIGFVHSNDIVAHSPILYSLIMFGVFGLLFWIFIFSNYIRIFRHSRFFAILLLPSTIMLVLNDRFMNSNSFPVIYYFFILQLARYVVLTSKRGLKEGVTPRPDMLSFTRPAKASSEKNVALQ